MKKQNNHPFHNGNEQKFLESMLRGNVYSRAQAKHVFKLKNPSAALIRFEEDKNQPVSRIYSWDKKAKTYKVKYFIPGTSY